MNYLQRKVAFLGLSLFVLFGPSAFASENPCPGADLPPPPILNVDVTKVISLLEGLTDTQGRSVWKTTSENQMAVREIFDSIPVKTKLEQFFQLLFLIQNQVDEKLLPLEVNPPKITELLLTAKVFTDPIFPQTITSVRLRLNHNHSPVYEVQFSKPEVRFPINQGQGFASWDQGMCQIAKELVFYPGFSFRLRKARNSKNLIAESFDKVEIFGQFGTRKIFSIDLKYVDLEKVEFIRGTDEGRVTARVAEREFEENKHSGFFKFIGTLIPNTSRQRIDW